MQVLPAEFIKTAKNFAVFLHIKYAAKQQKKRKETLKKKYKINLIFWRRVILNAGNVFQNLERKNNTRRQDCGALRADSEVCAGMPD